MKKEYLPSHTIYYPKLTSRRVDEEMGLAGKHEAVLLWIRIEVLE